MRAVRSTSRRAIDRKFANLGRVSGLTAPAAGWIAVIRRALGMTTAQLARRLSIAQPVVVRMEQSEAKGRIQLDTLRRAADALNCELVYALVPRMPLDEYV